MHDLELLRAGVCVAGLDGRVDEPELAVIATLVERVGVGRASLKAMIELSCSDKNLYKSQLRLAQPSPSAALEFLVKVAKADGHLTEDERRMIDRVRVYSSVEELRNYAESDFDDSTFEDERPIHLNAALYEVA